MKKTALITGATGGIGWILAHSLARHGYRLVLPCRNPERAEALRASLLLHSPGAVTDFLHCDLSDLAAVARCGRAVAVRHRVIDLVVANAATVCPARTLTPQGVECTFGVNHLAHFVLVHWLAGNFYTHSRVITVASSGARWGNPRFIEDAAYRRQHYGMFRAYANSKLANITFAASLAQRFEQRQIASVSVHPGMLDTDIWPRSTVTQRWARALLRKFCLEAPARGADAIEYLALAPEHNEACGYYCGRHLQAPPGRGDAAFADRLWQVSRTLAADFLPDEAL